MEYRPELDGIRAYGMIAVLAFHANVQSTISAWMAVTTFFVLSGFLITTIVLTEWERKGRVSMRNFYIRRLARLYPALFVLLALGLFFYKDLGARENIGGYGQTAAAAGLYYQDFIWGFAHAEGGHLGHSWSLAVEMQFYLVWPPVLLWLLVKKQKLLPWILGLAALSYGLLAAQSQEIVGRAFAAGYYLPWSRAGELLLGCAVAVVLQHRPAPDPEATPSRRWVGWLILAGFGFVMLVGTGPKASIITHPRAIIWLVPFVAALAVALMFHLHRVRGRGVGRILAFTPIAWLGARSYAFYLFHYPIIHILKTHYPEINLFGFKYDVAVDGLNMFFTAGAISLVLAAISWKLVEHPAQQWGRRRIVALNARETAAA